VRWFDDGPFDARKEWRFRNVVAQHVATATTNVTDRVIDRRR